MNDERDDERDPVMNALRKTKDKLKASADTPADRLALAVKDRAPGGFTEVFAHDVYAAAMDVKDADHTPASRALMRAADKNLRGAATTEYPAGAPLPDHKAREFVAAFSTGAVVELLELVKRGAA